MSHHEQTARTWLTSSVWQRLGLALVVVSALWGMVLWALDGAA